MASRTAGSALRPTVVASATHSPGRVDHNQVAWVDIGEGGPSRRANGVAELLDEGLMIAAASLRRRRNVRHIVSGILGLEFRNHGWCHLPLVQRPGTRVYPAIGGQL